MYRLAKSTASQTDRRTNGHTTVWC